MFTAIRKILLPGDSTLFARFSNLLMVVALLGMNVREKNIPSNYLHTSGNQILDSSGRWRTFNLPWNNFVHRSDWQPEGAPNDGFGLTTIWGFNISPVNGYGSFQVDEIKLINP
ncbi:MAG TPA: carbohydrate binding domain-containing protein [Anaerolineales bacterium]|nr:carbohydrate binding domain-containing protein [Anaerolineales bacterium]